MTPEVRAARRKIERFEEEEAKLYQRDGANVDSKHYAAIGFFAVAVKPLP